MKTCKKIVFGMVFSCCLVATLFALGGRVNTLVEDFLDSSIYYSIRAEKTTDGLFPGPYRIQEVIIPTMDMVLVKKLAVHKQQVYVLVQDSGETLSPAAYVETVERIVSFNLRQQQYHISGIVIDLPIYAPNGVTENSRHRKQYFETLDRINEFLYTVTDNLRVHIIIPDEYYSLNDVSIISNYADRIILTLMECDPPEDSIALHCIDYLGEVKVPFQLRINIRPAPEDAATFYGHSEQEFKFDIQVLYREYKKKNPLFTGFFFDNETYFREIFGNR